MKKFPDWDEVFSDAELDEEAKRYVELLNEAQASEAESEVEARLGRAEACRLAGEEPEPSVLAGKAAEYFNRSTLKVSELLTMMTALATENGEGTPLIYCFFENLYDLAFLLNYIVENVFGIITAGFEETAENGAEYSIAVAKMGMHATVGAIFAAVHEVLATDRAVIPEIMQEADEDATVYDIMKMIKEDYLLIERAADYIPTDGTEEFARQEPKRRRRDNRKKKTKKHQKDRQ